MRAPLRWAARLRAMEALIGAGLFIGAVLAFWALWTIWQDLSKPT